MLPSGISPNLVRLSGKAIYLLSTAYGHRESIFVLRLFSIGQYPSPPRWIRARYPTLSTATPESNEAAKQVGEFIHKLARKPESSCFEDEYRIGVPFVTYRIFAYVYVYIVLKNEPPYARSASILAFSENSSLFVSSSGESSDDEGIYAFVPAFETVWVGEEM